MQNEVIIAIITSISSILVAYISKYFSDKEKRRATKNTASAKNDEEMETLAKKRSSAYNDQESAYNELTLCTARYILTHDEHEKERMTALIDECRQKEEDYHKINSEFAEHVIRDIMKK